MENNLNDKYTRLLDEDEEFSLKKEKLLSLVNPENIKSEQSYELLQMLGGVSGLLSKLNISPEEGLNDKEVKQMIKRSAVYGTNEPVMPFTKNFLDCFIEILNQKIFLFLLFAATVRLVIDLWTEKGRWFDYSSIYFAVFIICLAMSIIEYSKEKVFQNFQININSKNVRVLRSGEEKLISQKELLVGDVLIINSGELIPVDGILIKAYSITIEQEDTLLRYHNIDHIKHKLYPAECDKAEFPFVLSGSHVIKGYGYLVVLCVGLETYLSKITIHRSNKSHSNSLNKEAHTGLINEDEEKEFEIGNSSENLITERNTYINRNLPSPAAKLKNAQQSQFKPQDQYKLHDEFGLASEDMLSSSNNYYLSDLKNSQITNNYQQSKFSFNNNNANFQAVEEKAMQRNIGKAAAAGLSTEDTTEQDRNHNVNYNNNNSFNKINTKSGNTLDNYDNNNIKNEFNINIKTNRNENFRNTISNSNNNSNNKNINNNYTNNTLRSILRRSERTLPEIARPKQDINNLALPSSSANTGTMPGKTLVIKEDRNNYADSNNKKDIVDYAEEFNQLTQTKKNIEIKSGYFRNKSITSINNFKKKEIVNVRSKDKRYTNSEIFYYSPLQAKIELIEKDLSKFGIIASIFSGLSYLLVYIFFSYPENFEFSVVIQIIIDALLYGLVLVVLAIPEGLPLASTLSAAFSINKMREENTIIKSIQACENMATINCICTDFNGVFTKNDMRVSRLFIEELVIDEKALRHLKQEISEDSFDFITEAISVNTIAYEIKNPETLQYEYFGDSIETSLIKFLRELRINYNQFRNNKKRPILECASFSAEFNVSFTVIEMDGKFDQVRLYVRGNPEDLIDNITKYITSKQTLEPINPKFKEKIKKFCKDVTKDGDMPMFICYRDVAKENFYKMRHAFISKEGDFLRSLVTQLSLIAVICLKDEIKEDVKTYIEECNNAGIIIKMVTVQDRETAKIAAQKCGILTQNLKLKKQSECESISESNQNSEFDQEDNNTNKPDTCSNNDNTQLITKENYKIDNFRIDKYNTEINKSKSKKTHPAQDKNNTNVNVNINNTNTSNTNFKKKQSKKSSNKNLLLKNSLNMSTELDILDCQEDLKKLIDLKLKRKSMSFNNSYHSFEFLINDINKFEEIIQNSKVISKATAKDKYILISTLKKNGFVVALTGDSVSDFLAMKSAQVSISMGFKATDMSKESADVILCDNSFKNILTGIIYGRNIYLSVRKFIQFQVTATISIITLALICALPLINFYFYPNQLLWLNLILDTFGSISLASEQANKDELLSRKPYSNKKHLISNSMKLRIIVQASLQIVIIMIMVFVSPMLFYVESDMGLKHIQWMEENGQHTTIVFTCLVYLQFFNAFISRSMNKNNLNIFKNILNHRIFIFIQTFTLLLHYLIVTYSSRLIRSKPLPILFHVFCFLIASLVLIYLPIIKYVMKNFKSKIKKL